MRAISSMPKNIQVLLLITLFQCLVWSLYQILLRPLIVDKSLEEITRSLIRISIIGIPAIIYIYKYKRESIRNYLNTYNLKLALSLGIVTSIIIFLFFLPQLNRFSFPLDISAWINWIIGSPVTEELYFRGIILNEFLKKYSILKSVIFSTVLFTAFHLPQWIFTQKIEEYITTIIMIFVYGILFSLLWVRTKSLFAALLPHSVNNFLYMATSVVR